MSTTLEKGGEYTKSICDSDLFNSILFQIKLIKKLVINRKTNTLLGAQMYGSNLSVLRINFL
uniref:hypothetical protein n=1 Tax=Mycoplasmopsis bovis TaxID=28903 RepID=UPI003D282442